MTPNNATVFDSQPEVLFLSWGSPWPPQGGGTLRTFGLLKELSRSYTVHLLVLSRNPLPADQETELRKHADSVTRVAMAGVTSVDKLRILIRMFARRMPYHCALLDLSFNRAPQTLEFVRAFGSVVYACGGHWATLVRDRAAANWILDQFNADVDFWCVYAGQATSMWLRSAALVNWRLAAAHYPRIYPNVGHIVSVCEEDRELTLKLAPQAQVDVIENGIDCHYYVPNRAPRSDPPRLLFTGTSAPRNVTALRQFTRNVWPMVQKELPEAELLVAGDFKPEAQVEFRRYSNVHFTGRIDDMRPCFNQSHMFIAPFQETHGSKLKIAEAMAMGMPIVSTPQGIRGFALVNGESVLLAHSDEQFAAHVVLLSRDTSTQNRLGAAARRVALSTIDWAVLSQRLTAIVDSVSASLRRGEDT